MTVYGIFGDTPRSDAENIDSIYLNREEAEFMKEQLNQSDKWTTYHIEELEVIENEQSTESEAF